MNKRPRILHIHLALYQPWLMTRALRERGFQADYVLFEWANKHRWLIHGYDINLNYRKESILSRIRALGFFVWAATHYDLFHIHRPTSFLPFPEYDSFFYGFDLALLRRLGKKIVYSHWGCQEGRLPHNFSKDGGKYICSFCKGRFNDCSDRKVIVKNYIQHKYAHAIINHEPDFDDLNAGAVYIPGAVDTHLWSPTEKIPEHYRIHKTNSPTLKVFHSLGNSSIRGGEDDNVKGSRYVREAVEQLRREGMAVEFLFFDRVPSPEIRFYQLQADIVVDQLLYGWYGSTAREAMSLGKPVIGYLRDDMLCHHPDLPIVNATKDTIKDVLRALIEDPEKRKIAGRKGRDFVQRVHGTEVVAAKLINLYESLYTPN